MAAVGAGALIAAFVSYATLLSRFPAFSVESAQILEPLAYGFLALVLGGLFALGFGGYRLLSRSRSADPTVSGVVAPTLAALARVTQDRKYLRIITLTAIAYGVFLAFTSSTVVYQPGLSFSDAYGAQVPSGAVVLCCGPVGQVPRFIVYLTEHLGLLIVPLNVVLLFFASGLVGLNMALAWYAYANRPQVARRGWFAGFGAAVGLFTGCPACASLVFASGVAGLGAVTVATVLASLQTVFIAISLPVLALTPFLITRNGFALPDECAVPKAMRANG